MRFLSGLFVCLAIWSFWNYTNQVLRLNYIEYLILTQTNQERVGKGLQALELNPKLHSGAQKYANLMGKKNRLSHDIENLSTRIKRENYNYSTIGENIAWNYGFDKVVDGWMDSPGHRANILNKSFTQIGVGVDYNSKNEPYYCQIFGKPMLTEKAMISSSLMVAIMCILSYVIIYRNRSKIVVLEHVQKKLSDI